MKKWIAKLKDGRVISENDETGSIKWDTINDEVSEIVFDNDGQMVILPSNVECYFSKTASVAIGSDNIAIESRNLIMKVGNKEVIMRIDEQTNNIQIEVK